MICVYAAPAVHRAWLNGKKPKYWSTMYVVKPCTSESFSIPWWIISAEANILNKSKPALVIFGFTLSVMFFGIWVHYGTCQFVTWIGLVPHSLLWNISGWVLKQMLSPIFFTRHQLFFKLLALIVIMLWTCWRLNFFTCIKLLAKWHSFDDVSWRLFPRHFELTFCWAENKINSPFPFGL